MEKEGRGIFRAGRGTQPGTAHSENSHPGKGTGSGEGAPRASRHSRSDPPPTPRFAPTSRGPSGQLWKDVQGTALAEGER